MQENKFTTFGDLMDWDYQMSIWGYELQGNMLEQDALLAEGSVCSQILWDATSEELNNRLRCINGVWERVPDWHAFHYLPWK